MKILFFWMLFLSLLCEDSYAFSDSDESNTSYIDRVHKAVSSKVHEWAVDIDGMFLGAYEYFEETNTSKSSKEDYRLGDNNLTEVFDITFPGPDSYRISSGPEEDNATLQPQMADKTGEDDNRSEFEFFEEETDPNSLEEKIRDEESRKIKDTGFDAFFLTRRELEERDRSYVRLRFSQFVHSLQKEETKVAVRARLDLGRSRKKLKLVLENENDDATEGINAEGGDDTTVIGVERSSRRFLGIKPKYSIGFRGVDPYARARYYYETEMGWGWKFHPVQTFLYTVDEEFSELTALYFDRPTSENTLFRLLLDRGTEDRVDGMRYDGYIQWFYHPRQHAGLSLSFGINAHTKYQDVILEPDPFLVREQNRAYNYLVSISWRENVWKKWLFYEISPGVNYHKQHDFRPNYNITFRIELFFGHV